jgi:LIVCS family branched-chain amino acid:cation transporter
LLSIGAAIFGMHFGASSLLWPATWGRNSGTEWLTAFGGYSFAGLLLPALGYVAVVRGGSFLVLLSLVGRRFALLFGGFVFFIVGPLFAIPRMSAAAWDAVTRALYPIFGGASSKDAPWWAMLLFTLAFYLLIYWFICNKNRIVDKLSRFAIPALFLLEAFLIFSVVAEPVGEAVPPNYSRSPFSFGFISGYQTMDLPAALIYSGLILADIRGRGVAGSRGMALTLFKAMLIGFSVFGLATFGELYRGSTASGVFMGVSYADLSVDIVAHQWGAAGASLFNVALLLACIPSSVGLTASTADFLQKATNGRVPYTGGCIFALSLSCLISLAGLEIMVRIVTPALNFIYPPCIAIALAMAFMPGQTGVLRGACYFAAVCGLLEAAHGYLELAGHPGALGPLLGLLPLSADGLAFVSFVLLGGMFGKFFLNRAA